VVVGIGGGDKWWQVLFFLSSRKNKINMVHSRGDSILIQSKSSKMLTYLDIEEEVVVGIGGGDKW